LVLGETRLNLSIVLVVPSVLVLVVVVVLGLMTGRGLPGLRSGERESEWGKFATIIDSPGKHRSTMRTGHTLEAYEFGHLERGNRDDLCPEGGYRTQPRVSTLGANQSRRFTLKG
jgi:hypothetical protein